MWTGLLALITELIANKKRGMWLTILLIVLLGNVGFFFGFTKDEIKAANTPYMARIDSLVSDRNQLTFQMQFFIREQDDLKKSLDRLEGKIDRLDDKIDKLKKK